MDVKTIISLYSIFLWAVQNRTKYKISGFLSYEYILKIHSTKKKKASVYLSQFNYVVKIAISVDAYYLHLPNLSPSLSNS